MKKLLTATLLTIATATTAWLSPLQAEEIRAANPNLINSEYSTVKPFNLIYLGYQGYFTNQGIPSNGAFSEGVQSGKINAEDLIQVAVATGRLPESALTDQAYINHVEGLLFNFNMD